MLKKFNRYRDISKFLLETIVWSLVTVIAFLLRLDGNLTGFESEVIWSAGTLLILKSASILYFGTFRQSWRNTGFRDLFTLLRSVLIVSIIFLIGTIAFRGRTLFADDGWSLGRL